MGIWAGRAIGKVISIRPLIRKQINRGPPCHRVFIIYVNVRLRRRAIQISSQMLVLSTATLGAKLSLHQDKDEPDLRAPIVSVSLGLPAIFSLVA